ncbi:hypothetical protein AKJ09_10271 [Labilithrix luteola]|uniref:Uncharacterized protein n=1 Tax=Labilithrix luteola TaxID=1391654 RepID=A0A0K1QD03_9BACT|nr:hypothetical protein AKJ09_10271 [Labilithrix luteola]
MYAFVPVGPWHFDDASARGPESRDEASLPPSPPSAPIVVP